MGRGVHRSGGSVRAVRNPAYIMNRLSTTRGHDDKGMDHQRGTAEDAVGSLESLIEESWPKAMPVGTLQNDDECNPDISAESNHER